MALEFFAIIEEIFENSGNVDKYQRKCYLPRRGVTEEVPAVGFYLGSGLFGSYNSD